MLMIHRIQSMPSVASTPKCGREVVAGDALRQLPHSTVSQSGMLS